MSARPRPFTLDSGHIGFEVDDNDPETLASCLDFTLGFFGLVPTFVWDNLGLSDPPAL